MNRSMIAITVTLFAAGCAVEGESEDATTADSALGAPPSNAADGVTGPVRGRIKEVYGPFSDRSSSVSTRHIYFEVPETFADHCVQNDGAGEFYDTKAGNGKLRREYRCSFLLTTAEDLAAHRIAPTARLGHWHWTWIELPYPEFRNPDKDSSRYWVRRPVGEFPFGIDKEQYSYRQSTSASGRHMPAANYQGSPAGADGFYHVVEVTCRPKGFYNGYGGPPGPTQEDVDAQCDRNEMVRIAKALTTGPTETLVTVIP